MIQELVLLLSNRGPSWFTRTTACGGSPESSSEAIPVRSLLRAGQPVSLRVQGGAITSSALASPAPPGGTQEPSDGKLQGSSPGSMAGISTGGPSKLHRVSPALAGIPVPVAFPSRGGNTPEASRGRRTTPREVAGRQSRERSCCESRKGIVGSGTPTRRPVLRAVAGQPKIVREMNRAGQPAHGKDFCSGLPGVGTSEVEQSRSQDREDAITERTIPERRRSPGLAGRLILSPKRAEMHAPSSRRGVRQRASFLPHRSSRASDWLDEEESPGRPQVPEAKDPLLDVGRGAEPKKLPRNPWVATSRSRWEAGSFPAPG